MPDPTRREILDRWNEVRNQMNAIPFPAPSPDEFQRLRELVWAHAMSYQRWVPTLPLSRCPFTGAVFHHSIDPEGLDGLWWDASGAMRPSAEGLPPSFFTLLGAMRLHEPVEWTPFLCRPGPGVPYVNPRLLGHPDMRAVVSSTPVGRHTAYPIAYFAQPMPELERVNIWGSSRYTFTDAKGKPKWGNTEDDSSTFDYALEPWIESGKLLWIAPGDESLALRGTVAGCPYLGLEGPRDPQRVSEGAVHFWPAADSGS